MDGKHIRISVPSNSIALSQFSRPDLCVFYKIIYFHGLAKARQKAAFSVRGMRKEY